MFSNLFFPVLQKGQSMVEAVVALGAAVIIISTITFAVITSASNTSFSTDQNKATQLAQEGLDAARKLRNSDANTFFSISEETTFCLPEGSAEFPELSNESECNDRPNVGSYIRKVRFIPNSAINCGGDVTEVRSIVEWSTGKCTSTERFCHNVELVSCFADINSLNTPVDDDTINEDIFEPPEIDTDPPFVAITNPPDGTDVGWPQTVTIRVSATDDSGIDNVKIYINSNELCTRENEPYECNWSVPFLSPAVTVRAIATDTAGNTPGEATIQLQ